MAVRPSAAADGGGGPAGAGGDRSGRPRLQPGPGPEPDQRLPDRHHGAGRELRQPASRRRSVARPDRPDHRGRRQVRRRGHRPDQPSRRSGRLSHRRRRGDDAQGVEGSLSSDGRGRLALAGLQHRVRRSGHALGGVERSRPVHRRRQRRLLHVSGPDQRRLPRHRGQRFGRDQAEVSAEDGTRLRPDGLSHPPHEGEGESRIAFHERPWQPRTRFHARGGDRPLLRLRRQMDRRARAAGEVPAVDRRLLAVLQRCEGSAGERHRRHRGAGLRPVDAAVAAGTAEHRRSGRGRRRARAGGDAGLRQGAQGLRQAGHRLPEHPVQTGRDQDQADRRQGLRRPLHRPAPERPAGRRHRLDGQILGDGHPGRDHRRDAAALRRLRLYDRISDRPALQGRPRPAHLRRHERDHEAVDRADAVVSAPAGRPRSGRLRRQSMRRSTARPRGSTGRFPCPKSPSWRARPSGGARRRGSDGAGRRWPPTGPEGRRSGGCAVPRDYGWRRGRGSRRPSWSGPDRNRDRRATARPRSSPAP
uniref:LigA n=1 Tax=Parastrongyloides trichosuri TaxID=131310 RepID=A0A0N4ZIR0_PARTI